MFGAEGVRADFQMRSAAIRLRTDNVKLQSQAESEEKTLFWITLLHKSS